MHIDGAVNSINDQALPKSEGHCATHVRRAFAAGGVIVVDPDGKPFVSAEKYYDGLEKYFKKVEPTPPPDYSPQKGDIAVFKSPGDKHPDGHIQIYNGKEWVSDFKQPRFWPNQYYKDNKAKYKIFRPENWEPEPKKPEKPFFSV